MKTRILGSPRNKTSPTTKKGPTKSVKTNDLSGSPLFGIEKLEMSNYALISSFMHKCFDWLFAVPEKRSKWT